MPSWLITQRTFGIIFEGVKKLGNVLKPFTIEFRPYVEDINEKAGAVRECADQATMHRIRGKYATQSCQTHYLSGILLTEDRLCDHNQRVPRDLYK